MDDTKYRNPLEDRHVGIVKANVDPTGNFRVKLWVEEVHGPFVSADVLPWACQERQVESGSGHSTGALKVPLMESKVRMYFDKGSRYSPMYYAEVLEVASANPNNVGGSPDVEVEQRPGGTFLTYNRKSKNYYWEHPMGINVKVDPAGDLFITSSNNATFQFDKKVKWLIGEDLDIEVGGNYTLLVEGDFNMESLSYTLETNEYLATTDAYTLDTGPFTVNSGDLFWAAPLWEWV